MARILLVDADSANGFPNLALMKLSKYHKLRGNQVFLIKGIPTTPPLEKFDRGYISTIFFQNKERVQDYASQLSFPVEVGGSGWGMDSKLPNFIEHLMPDYELYGIDFSMGFTSRGCIRKCGFCIVYKKEGHIRNHAPIFEFLNPEHEKLILLDNNFLASPRCKQNLQEIAVRKLKINFNQGLDIRLVTEENAALLAQVKVYSWNFRTKCYHFAFDSPRHEKAVRRGIETLDAAGIRPSRLMIYVLVGYNTTVEQDMHRVRVISELGAIPYIMPYNKSSDPKIKHLARWVNRRYYQFVPWEQYTPAQEGTG